MAGADEAGQTPRAAVQTPETADQATQASRRVPGASNEAAQTSERSPATDDHATDDSGQATSAAAATTEQEPAPESAGEQLPQAPGFGERGRMRRRARFLRKARELAYRDLGGLVFDLHRFGQRNDQLVLAKLATLRQIDSEVRKLEEVLHDRRPVTVLREVGIAACPRCAAIHGSDDRFCPGCGLAFDTNADRPISTASVTPQAQASVPGQPQVLATQVTAPTPTPTPAPATGPMPVPAPPPKATAPPVAAKPAFRPSASEGKASQPAQEDEPTQILRPPSGGAGA